MPDFPGNCDLGGGAVLCSPQGWETPPRSPSAALDPTPARPERFLGSCCAHGRAGGQLQMGTEGSRTPTPQIWALSLHPAWPEPVLAVLRWGQVRKEPGEENALGLSGCWKGHTSFPGYNPARVKGLWIS